MDNHNFELYQIIEHIYYLSMITIQPTITHKMYFGGDMTISANIRLKDT